MHAKVGPYSLIRRLAVGGMGEVFLAELESGEEPKLVALKRILPHLTTERQFVDRFVDEARLMTSLDHPNILPVYELRHDTWGLYMVMEYLAGQDVRTVNRILAQRGERWPTELAVWLIREVCLGLTYAHEQRDDTDEPLGLIHRDLSPSNILLGDTGEVKIIDFGVARAHGNIHQSISGALQGKLAYMSPEQARGEPLTLHSDLFSLGITLMEMVSGSRPRSGRSDADILRQAQSDEVITLESVWPEAPSSLCSIINRSVHPQPERRYHSSKDFSEALENWLLNHSREASKDCQKTHLESLRSTFVEWRASLGAIATITPLNLDEALELQLLGDLSPAATSEQETLSLNPVQEQYELNSSLSGLLITHERANFSEIYDALIDEPVADLSDEPPQKNSADLEIKPLKQAASVRLKLRQAKIAMSLILALSSSALIWSLTKPRMTSLVPQQRESPLLVKQEQARANGDRDAHSMTLSTSSLAHRSTTAKGLSQEEAESVKLTSLNLEQSQDQLTQSTKGQSKKTTLRERSTASSRSQELNSRHDLMLNVSLPRASAQQLSALNVDCTKSPQGKQVKVILASSKTEEAYFRLSYSQSLKCLVSAPGYESDFLKLQKGQRANEVRLKLKPQGTLSVRVYPPATKLTLNGKIITNPTQQYSISGENHLLRGSYLQGEEVIEREWKISLRPGQRLKKFFDLTTANSK